MLTTTPRQIPRLWTLVPALCLAVLLSSALCARADEGEEAVSVEETKAAEEPGLFQAFCDKLDYSHDCIERYILEQAVNLDDFFGTENPYNVKPTRFELRLRNSLRIEQEGTLKYGPSVRISFALSKINNRLRLVIAGEDEPEPNTRSLPRDPGNPGFDRTTPNTHFVNTEVRYDLIRNPSLLLFLGAGVRLKLPFEAFVRSRLDYTRTFSDKTLIRFGETLFVKNTDLLGETTEITLDHLLDPQTILRWSSAGTASQEIRGLEWGSELSLIRELSPQSAITLTGGTYGNTTNSTVANTYRIQARYRRNFLRSWLFYELEPEIFWERNRINHDAPMFAFTFRLEVVFKGSSLGFKRDTTPGT